MINFMLPVQLGAITFDGTWLIVLGILAVAGIVYKNRSNISLTSTGSITNENTDINSNYELEEDSVQSSTIKVNVESEEFNNTSVKESVEDFSQEVEKEKVFN